MASVSNRSDDTSFSTHPSLPSSIGGGSSSSGGNGHGSGHGGGSSGGRSGISSRPGSMLRRNVLAGFDSASDLGIVDIHRHDIT